jgi:hypothetical protein
MPGTKYTQSPIDVLKQIVNQKLTVAPITEQVQDKTIGRKRIPRKPNLPALNMNDTEKAWIEYQMYIYNQEYDLNESDQIQLHLLAVEYVKYMRTITWELETNQEITMARQHPGTRYDALIDRLGLTRRHRLSKSVPEDAEKRSIQDALRSLSG